MTGGFTISLIWSKNAVFLFDSHSRDGNGAFTNNGSSVVLSFKSLIDVNNYIKMEYSKHFSDFHEKLYEIQYVRIRPKGNTSANVIKRNRRKFKIKHILIIFMELLSMIKLKFENAKIMPNYLVLLSMIK